MTGADSAHPGRPRAASAPISIPAQPWLRFHLVARQGAMAQLVARFHGMEEATGSNPVSSTETKAALAGCNTQIRAAFLVGAQHTRNRAAPLPKGLVNMTSTNTLIGLDCPTWCTGPHDAETDWMEADAEPGKPRELYRYHGRLLATETGISVEMIQRESSLTAPAIVDTFAAVVTDGVSGLKVDDLERLGNLLKIAASKMAVLLEIESERTES